MRSTILSFLAALAMTPLLASCSKVALFDTLVPYDSGARRVAHDVAYGDEPRQSLDIYRPKNASGSTPVVFFIYGGSWDSGSKANYAFVGNAFAAAGYVTVIADYRLVPEVRYPAFVEDDAKALAWTVHNIARYGGDPHRLFVAAHSAGSYNAMMLASDPHFLRAEGLSPSDLSGVAALSGPYDFLPLAAPSTKAAFGNAPDLKATQPINHVHSGMPPIFLATGRADTTVRPRNTTLMGEKLAAAGVPHTVKTYPDIGHAGMVVALARPFRGRAPVLHDMLAFFARHGGVAPSQ
ncbi:alpha/beta hydrolase [Pararhizobium mangrovi]|uniref:alpha/beta hydrolase n=1 Tax=Pararhizobium mangrovi TaxID=2590452 RepID=UPI001F19A598|nr:alpha/beta hydrolase [Pararhizobium mangrovi]